MTSPLLDTRHPVTDAALSVLPLGQDLAYTSRVRAVGKPARNGLPALLVTSPRDEYGEVVSLRPGESLTISWQAADGYRSMPAEVGGAGRDRLWTLLLTGTSMCTQRREAVRAPLGLPVEVGFGSTWLAGSTVDLSEGGMRCVFRQSTGLLEVIGAPVSGSALRLKLDLYSDVLEADAAFVRQLPRSDDRVEWSLRFLDMPESTRDVIRSHVFTALRNARARGLV